MPSTGRAARQGADTAADSDAGASAEGVEVEAKFAVERPAEIRALLMEPDPSLLAGFGPDGPPSTKDIVDRYLDTALGGGALRAAGLRARLRISVDGVVLAVKGRSAVSAGGVATRMELEGPASADPDPGRWPASAARQLVAETVAGAPLIEIAAVRQERHVRLVRRGASVIELSLDQMTALGADGAALATRVELEAELKAGPAAALEEVASALALVDGVGPPLGSKLEFALGVRLER